MNALKLTLVPSLVATMLVAAPAFAQDGSVEMAETSDGGETPPMDAPMAGAYPLKFAARPLTLNKMMVRAEFDLLFPKFGDFGVALALGGAFGVTDDLEVGATLIPLTLSPSAGYGDIPIYGRFRFLKGKFELGAQLTLVIPTSTDFGLTPGLVGQFESGNFRLEFGALIPLTFSDPLRKGLNIPITASLNFSDNLWGQVRTGIQLPEFDGLNIPLGVGVFYAMGKGNQPMLDVGAAFDWPLYLNTSLPDTLNFDVFTITLAARFHLFL